MSGRGGRRGRPWTPLPPDLDPDTAELLRVLRELVDRSGLGLKGLGAALTPDHFNGAQPPAYNKLSRCLKGEGIGNAGLLVSAIVQICASPEEREAKAAEVERLKVAARAASQNVRPAPEDVPDRADRADRSDRSRETAVALEAARNRIIELQNELAAERRRAEESERTLALLFGMLGRPPATTEAPAAPRPAATAVVPPRRPRPVPQPARIEAVAATLRALDPDGERIARALRTAVDETLDGRHTGRYRLDQLHRAERIHLGAKVEIVLAAALGLAHGHQMDFSIAGCEVDLGFTTGRNWIFGPEQVGQVCLLVQLDEDRSEWSAGLIVVEEHLLSVGMNHERKRALSPAGREAVLWLFRRAPLPPNTLLSLEPEQVAVILSHRSARDRVTELLRTAQRRPITPASMATVAMQEDHPRRVREAIPLLAEEGIAALGWIQQQEARALGLPVLRPGELVTARLAPLGEDEGDTPSVRFADGRRWTLARPGDPVEPLPGPWPWSRHADQGQDGGVDGAEADGAVEGGGR